MEVEILFIRVTIGGGGDFTQVCELACKLSAVPAGVLGENGDYLPWWDDSEVCHLTSGK